MNGEFDARCRFPATVVWPVPLDPSGRAGPTRGQAQGPRWRQSTKGFYVPADVPDAIPEQRVVEHAMRLPRGGLVTGWAALRLAGATYFDGRGRHGDTQMPVPLLVPRASRIRSLPRSTVMREPIASGDRAVLHGVPATIAVRALFDEARALADPREAVVALDMAAAAVLVSRAELAAYARGRSTWRRSGRLAWALRHASERSLSPGETRTRLVWILDATLPPPLVNQEVWDRHGRLLGIADLLDPTSGVVVEYDGATHLRLRNRTADISREDGFRRSGLELVTVTALDLHERRRLAERMRSTRARAMAHGRPRGWTLRPPPGWRSRMTAEDALATRDLRRSWHETG